MIDSNMPSGKAQAQFYLAGKKAQLMQLAELIASNEITAFSQVNKFIYSEMEIIDEEMEG